MFIHNFYTKLCFIVFKTKLSSHTSCHFIVITSSYLDMRCEMKAMTNQGPLTLLVAINSFLEHRRRDRHMHTLADLSKSSKWFINWHHRKLYHSLLNELRLHHLEWELQPTELTILTNLLLQIFVINHWTLAFGGELTHTFSYVYQILAPASLSKIIRLTWRNC